MDRKNSRGTAPSAMDVIHLEFGTQMDDVERHGTPSCHLTALLTIVLPTLADETLTTLKVGDTIYSNVVVLKVTATDLLISSAHGIGNVKLKNLEPEWQRHFNYDPVKGADAEPETSCRQCPIRPFFWRSKWRQRQRRKTRRSRRPRAPNR